MDLPSLILNMVTLAISIAALFLTVQVAVRQARYMRHANYLPVIREEFGKFRSPDFRSSEGFVLGELAATRDPSRGFSNLPEPANSAVTDVSFFCDSLGVLVAFGVIDQDLVCGVMGTRATRCWTALRPYIERERELRQAGFQRFFEDLVCRIEENPPDSVAARLQLRKASRLGE